MWCRRYGLLFYLASILSYRSLSSASDAEMTVLRNSGSVSYAEAGFSFCLVPENILSRIWDERISPSLHSISNQSLSDTPYFTLRSANL